MQTEREREVGGELEEHEGGGCARSRAAHQRTGAQMGNCAHGGLNCSGDSNCDPTLLVRRPRHVEPVLQKTWVFISDAPGCGLKLRELRAV